SLQRKRGRARGNPQPGDFGERVDQLVGDAVAQVLVFGVRAGIDEGQHSDRPRDGGTAQQRGRRQELGDEIGGGGGPLIGIFLQRARNGPLERRGDLRSQ